MRYKIKSHCFDPSYMKYVENMVQGCAGQLKFWALESGEKQVFDANFCHMRLCPVCNGRRVLRADYLMQQVMNKVCSDYGAEFVYLRFDFLKADGDNLREVIKELKKAWKRFVGYRGVKEVISGWFRAVRIKKCMKNGKWDGTYQLCIYAILSVEPGCFRRSKVEQFGQLWNKVIGVDGRSLVKLEKTQENAVRFAACAVSESDFLKTRLPEKESVKVVRDYTEALRRQRTTAYGGWMEKAAISLGAENLEDGDLIHIEDETVTEETADFIETYYWHYGVQDYVLGERVVNPLKKS